MRESNQSPLKRGNEKECYQEGACIPKSKKEMEQQKEYEDKGNLAFENTVEELQELGNGVRLEDL